MFWKAYFDYTTRKRPFSGRLRNILPPTTNTITLNCFVDCRYVKLSRFFVTRKTDP